MTPPKTPEELAEEYGDRVAWGDLRKKYEPTAPGNYFDDELCAQDAFRAGHNAALSTLQDQLRAARKEGWDAARKGTPLFSRWPLQEITDSDLAEGTFNYTNFEDWEKEREKK